MSNENAETEQNPKHIDISKSKDILFLSKLRKDKENVVRNGKERATAVPFLNLNTENDKVFASFLSEQFSYGIPAYESSEVDKGELTRIPQRHIGLISNSSEDFFIKTIPAISTHAEIREEVIDSEELENTEVIIDKIDLDWKGDLTQDVEFNLVLFAQRTNLSHLTEKSVASPYEKGTQKKIWKKGSNNEQGLDIITTIEYLDKAGNVQDSEVLRPGNLDDIQETYTIYPVKVKKEKKGLFKKIRIVVRKIGKVIRTVLKGLKGVVASDTSKIVEALSDFINFEKRYKILKYDNEGGRLLSEDGLPSGKKELPLLFKEISTDEIDVKKKTLLLFHGFFAKCFRSAKAKKKKDEQYYRWAGSFGGLLTKEKFSSEEQNWFEYLLSQGGEGIQQYEQILAIDRETLFNGPKENVEYFMRTWEWDNKLKFEKGLSILCTSQGGFLGRYLPNTELADNLNIDRIALVASGYFKNYRKIDSILSFILKSLDKQLNWAPYWKLLLTLPFEIMLEMPGTKTHNNKGDIFKKIYKGEGRDIIYYNVVNNVDKGIRFDGGEGDSLLSLEAQRDCEPGRRIKPFITYENTQKHGTAFASIDVKKEVAKFLVHEFDVPEEPLKEFVADE